VYRDNKEFGIGLSWGDKRNSIEGGRKWGRWVWEFEFFKKGFIEVRKWGEFR
jgi:hypothetical protein